MADPLTAADLQAAVERLADQLRALAKTQPIALLGIANGGITLAQHLARQIGEDTQWGTLNALFHRDDVGSKPVLADFKPTSFDFAVDDAHLVLIDDVYASGRTIRAALNELFDHGRPASVSLAVLVDTRRRVLPIRPDFCGLEFPCEPHTKLHVSIDPEDSSAHTAQLVSLS